MDQRRPLDVEALYLDDSSAAEAIKDLRAAGMAIDADREEYRDPLTEPERQAEDIDAMGAGPGPSIPAMSNDQYRDSIAGAAAGLAILAGVGLIVAAILRAVGTVGWPGFIAVVVAGGVAGATAGAVIGGREGGEQQISREKREHLSGLHLVVHARDDAEAARAHEMLARRRPERLGDLRRNG